MIRFLTAALLTVLAVMQPARADAPAAYNDSALHFSPPVTFQEVPLPPVDLAEQAHLATVAAYVRNRGREDQLSILIMMELFRGSLKDFEATVENELRSQIDGIFLSRKVETRLPNGMPAWWLKFAYGSGFESMQQYVYAAVDGRRGVTISITGHLGVMSENDAKDALKDLALVLYP